MDIFVKEAPFQSLYHFLGTPVVPFFSCSFWGFLLVAEQYEKGYRIFKSLARDP